MEPFLKKITTDEYMQTIIKNSEDKMPETKKQIKITDENIIIPTTKNYNDIVVYNYSLSQLKMIAKEYKLKITGNKKQIISRIFFYLYFSCHIVRIQKVFRGFLVKKYNEYHGPAVKDRNICTNTDDFVTMEPLDKIDYHQFISYKDTDGFIYGFDIISLHNLFLKSRESEDVRNPYNRNVIPSDIIKQIKSVIRISRILNIHINLQYEDDTEKISSEKGIELRCLTLFQTIDSLGNYSNSQWFLSLNRQQLIKFIRELCDIWNYRAQLANETKRSICPPHGDPFRSLSIQYIYTEPNIFNVRKVILEVLEKFVNYGISNDNKSLGAYYVLGALTLVNSDAASSLPWLYQSFCH